MSRVRFKILIFQRLPIITPLLLDQLTCFLPKNVPTIHEEKDGIIHFCLSSFTMGVYGTLNLHFDKKMDFSKLDFSTSSYHIAPLIDRIRFPYDKKEMYTLFLGISLFWKKKI